MELVLANGKVRWLDSERPEDSEFLHAARISLGSLGIVHKVTLNVVPVHNIEHFGKKATLAEALDPQNYLTNDHFEFAYFPFADTDPNSASCYMFIRNKTGKRALKKGVARWFQEEILENALAGFLLKLVSHEPSALPDLMRAFLESVPEVHDIDRCDRVMTTPRKVPSYLFEYAIPIDRAEEALCHLKDLAFEFAHLENNRFYLNLPAQIRFIRGDRGNFLSPTQGKDTCWFGIGSHIAHPGFEPLFVEMERRLREMGGRPHWGKMFFRNPRPLYEDFDRYANVRQLLDPTGKFMNRFMEKLLWDPSESPIVDPW
jgi:L-gulonolactone oxidase